MGEQSRQVFLSGFLKRVKELHPIDCAVVNCIVSTPILRPLWENDIPASHLIHEFSSYTRPETTFNESAFFSAKQIFSSNLLLENALSDYPNLASKSPMVLPQGRCLPPINEQESHEGMKERSRIDTILRPPGSPQNLFVVIGLGTVKLRKGVDLFLECAHKVSKLNSKVPIRFVWFGHGYNVKLDGDYSVYLHDQIKRSGIEQMCAITHETSQLDHVYETADLLFLSSRLDPLPLVSHDMMAHGKPVLCFEKATGLAEFLKDDATMGSCVIDYMDVEGAASRIVELANDHAEYQRVGKAFEAVIDKTFNLDRYAEQIHEHCEELMTHEESAKEDRDTIQESGLLDEKFFLHHAAIDQFGIKAYMSLWASGLNHRKPIPGFHPGIYAERNQISKRDPFAEYIRQGKPAGPWVQEVITPVEVTDEDLNKAQVPTALHLHLYYTEMADSILARIARCKSRPDLLISVGDQHARCEVEEVLSKYGLRAKRIAIVPNRGRDIGPFLTEFGREIAENYEIIGHLHSKKTVTIEDQGLVRTWADFLYGNLLGNEELMMDTILMRMGEDPSIGLVYPDDPFVMGWGENKKIAESLLGKMKVSAGELYENINFPVGTMFWARTKALKPLFNLKVDWSDYPEEPLPYDGSILHGIERLLPIIIKNNQYTEAVTYVEGKTR
jgi:glycosyltransferase involved in cell wall biosynthesis